MCYSNLQMEDASSKSRERIMRINRYNVYNGDES